MGEEKLEAINTKGSALVKARVLTGLGTGDTMEQGCRSLSHQWKRTCWNRLIGSTGKKAAASPELSADAACPRMSAGPDGA